MAEVLDAGAGGRSPRVRGTMVAARLAFATRRWGDAARARVLAALDEKDRQRAASVAFEGDWFALTALTAVEAAILELHGGDPDHALREMGRWSAEHSFARVAPQFAGQSPREVVARVARLGMQYQDFGQAEWGDLPPERGESRMWLSYRYPESVGPGYCRSGEGFLARLLELLGFGGVRVSEVACQAEGGTAHRYLVTWLWPEVASVDVGTLRRRSTSSPALQGVGLSSKPARDFATRRVGVLLVLLALAVAAALARETAAPLEGGSAAAAVVSYRCEGSLQGEVAFDTPDVLVRVAEPVASLAIEVIVDGRRFVATADGIPAGSWSEAPLDEFKRADGVAPARTVPPAVVSLRAISGGKAVTCECRRR